MRSITKKKIENLLLKVDENFFERDYIHQKAILDIYERRANVYNGERVDEITAIKMAFERLKYEFNRVYIEGKHKRTITTIGKHMKYMEYTINHLEYYGDFYDYKRAAKEAITYMQIILNVDVSFHTLLMDLYEICNENEKINFGDIENQNRRRRR